MTRRIKNTRFAVGYCRYSSDNQREESITAQKREIQKWADENDITIIAWYIDRATTGTSADREQWTQLKEDSKLGNFGYVLVHKENRFSRQQIDEQYREEKELRQNNVVLIAVAERFDNTPTGRMAKGVNRVINAWYSDNLGQEVIKGMKENVYAGKNNGGIVPFGYKLEPIRDPITGDFVLEKDRIKNQLLIHPKQAEAVKLIYDMTLKGYKRFEIIDRLNALGYTRTVYVGKGRNRPKEERDFTGAGTQIDHILRNPKYAGIYKMHYNLKDWDYDPEKDFVINENGYPQIIPKETYEAVQIILKQRVKNLDKSKEPYLLSGRIICGECGTPYTGARQIKKGKVYPYYKCNRQTTYKNGSHLAEYCKNNTVQRDKLEKHVTKLILKILESENTIDKVLDEYNKYVAEQSRDASYIEKSQATIKQIETQIDNLLNVISGGFLSDALKQKIESLEAQKRKYLGIIKEEEKAVVQSLATKAELKKVFQKAREELTNGTFEQRKIIINLFLNKIIIYRKSVEIFINLIPFTNLNGIDLSINQSDYLGLIIENLPQDSNNPQNCTENAPQNIEKDEINPSLSSTHLYSEKSNGSPGRI